MYRYFNIERREGCLGGVFGLVVRVAAYNGVILLYVLLHAELLCGVWVGCLCELMPAYQAGICCNLSITLPHAALPPSYCTTPMSQVVETLIVCDTKQAK